MNLLERGQSERDREDRGMIIFQRGVLLWTVLLASSTPLRADMIPPGPWERQVRQRFRFDNLADYPDFDFYFVYSIDYSRIPYSNESVVNVLSGRPVEISPGRSGTYVRLMALPKESPVPKFSNSWSTERQRWIREGPSNAIYSPRLKTLPNGGWTTSFDLTDQYLTPYRVTMSNGEIQVEQLSVEWRLDYLRTVILGLSLSFVCVPVGLWIARRRKKGTDAPQPSPPATV
jgi:hypothetical protein